MLHGRVRPPFPLMFLPLCASRTARTSEACAPSRLRRSVAAGWSPRVRRERCARQLSDATERCSGRPGRAVGYIEKQQQQYASATACVYARCTIDCSLYYRHTRCIASRCVARVFLPPCIARDVRVRAASVSASAVSTVQMLSVDTCTNSVDAPSLNEQRTRVSTGEAGGRGGARSGRSRRRRGPERCAVAGGGLGVTRCRCCLRCWWWWCRGVAARRRCRVGAASLSASPPTRNRTSERTNKRTNERLVRFLNFSISTDRPGATESGPGATTRTTHPRRKQYHTQTPRRSGRIEDGGLDPSSC
jgi:hypothetical protein